VEKVFRRFYRADTSRNRKTGGSGLGLAIVSAIVERHGGTVRMDRTPGGGATVHIEIPALLPSIASAPPAPGQQPLQQPGQQPGRHSHRQLSRQTGRP